MMAICSASAGCASYPARKTTSVYGYDDNPGFRAVITAARKNGVNPAFALAVARREAGGQCGLTSPAGAQGVLQVMPATARRYGLERKLLQCEAGATAGVLELKRLLKLFNGNQRKALIAYNCGIACVKRSRLPKETRHYVSTISKVQYALY